jgi:hypothetical protein
MRDIFQIVDALQGNYGIDVNTFNGSIHDDNLEITVKDGITIEEILLIVEGFVKNGYRPEPLRTTICAQTITSTSKKQIKTKIKTMIVIPMKDTIENRE